MINFFVFFNYILTLLKKIVQTIKSLVVNINLKTTLVEIISYTNKLKSIIRLNIMNTNSKQLMWAFIKNWESNFCIISISRLFTIVTVDLFFIFLTVIANI